MPSVIQVVGLTFLSLVSVDRRVMAQNAATCDALKTAIEGSTGSNTTTITLTASFSCEESISINAGSDIELKGQGNTITIDTSDSSAFTKRSFFINAGTFVLRDTTLVDDDQEDGTSSGVRGIHNEGALRVYDSEFRQLNVRTQSLRPDSGGAILSESGDVWVENSLFYSNMANKFGGAICMDDGSLDVVYSSFKNNEVSQEDTEDGVGQGGDIYVADGVVLSVYSTTFSSSSADFAGAAIKCCGATIDNCTFASIETSIEGESYGAVVSGLPSGDYCEEQLKVKYSQFTGCSTASTDGQGGAIAIFNTNTEIENTEILRSKGTGVVFVTDDASGSHKLELESVKFYENTDGSDEYENEDLLEQATALAVINTAFWGEEGESGSATLSNLYCFANEPYECEIVFHGVSLDRDEELKCQVCDIMGTREFLDDDIEEDEVEVDDRASDDGVDSTSQALIIGLSVALGSTLVVIAGLAAYKISARNNARRLMEQMRDSDL